MQKTNQPNILLIMADQLAAQALRLYGNTVCKTPNLDKLATTGTVFRNAYSNNPLCVPSRASMISGLHSTNIDVFDNANDLPSSVPTMAHYLRQAGYWTELCGKMHFIGPDQLHGFDHRLVTDVYPANYQWIADWNAGPAYVPSGTSLSGVVDAGPSIRTLQEDYDDEVEYHCIQSIYDRAREPDRQPFFELVSFTCPHTPFTVSEDYWNRYTEDEIDNPKVGPIPFDELDYHSKALFFAHGRHRHKITATHTRNARHAYYGMISYLDDKIGRILTALEKTGLRDNTAIFFTSDHGEMMGERGMWFKHSFWDWSARVPLIASIPGVKAGQVVEEPVSLVDLLPTFIDLADPANKAITPLQLDGNSLLSLIKTPNPQWSHAVVSDYLAIGPCVPCRMIRRGQFKYIMADGHPSLLFDLVKDLDELNNLIDSPEHFNVQQELHLEATLNWHPQQLRKRVLESQQRRRMIANVPGAAPQWDYLARDGDQHRYVRLDGVDTTKARARLPRITPTPCNWPALEAPVVRDLIEGKSSIDSVLPGLT
ncbi:MAG: choline-sulfatase [Parasphingorhabdus sp.]|jgi:choline-sulfatase